VADANGPLIARAPAMIGRPKTTTRAEIEEHAFRLFHERGFEATTLDAIAESLEVSRRTLFRYFASKNDIAWGEFDRGLAQFRVELGNADPSRPIHEALRTAVIAFNQLPAEAVPGHRLRMRLILQTPALQAHSTLRYREWRGVVSDFVAARIDQPAESLVPRTAGHLWLAVAVSAYEEWLASDSDDLGELLGEAADAVAALVTGDR
jgi:mycofactocin system transcriptional regulator